MTTLSLLVSCILVLLAAAPATAQVYRWTDENGVPHFSDVVPSGEQAETFSPAESEPRAEDAASRERGEEPAAKAADTGPFAGLSDDAFSTTVTRERLTLRRELGAATRELTEATRALEDERERKAQPTPALEYERIIRGVSDMGRRTLDRENELEARKEAATKRVELIRQRFAELENEATRRHGALPSWWVPLER